MAIFQICQEQMEIADTYLDFMHSDQQLSVAMFLSPLSI